MLTEQYPDICYSPEYEIQPVGPSSRVRATANGRAHIQHLSIYDDAVVTITHPWATQTERDELLRFWDSSRSTAFIWADKLGDQWEAEFLGRPQVRREENQYRWTLTVQLLIRRLDQ